MNTITDEAVEAAANVLYPNGSTYTPALIRRALEAAWNTLKPEHIACQSGAVVVEDGE
jgi:hypothetical protein